MRRFQLLFVCLLAAAAIAVVLGSGAPRANAAGLCAYPINVATSGLTGTATFSVASGCGTVQVSLVAVSYFGGGSGFIFDSATGFFTAGPSYSLSVKVPCGTNGELDLELGPPTLFPPLAQDLRAVAYNVPCTPPPPAPKVKCNSGRGNLSETKSGTRKYDSTTLIDPHNGGTGPGTSPTDDCDPGNSGSHNSGGD